MKFETLKKCVLRATKGSFHNMVWERTMKTKRAFSGNTITKRCSGVVRWGICYDNIKAVVEKRNAGVLPQRNMGLPWGEWEMYPYFISHKGKRYLRCATTQTPLEVTYFLNGVEIPKESIAHMLLASETKEHSMDVFSVDIDNIISVR